MNDYLDNTAELVLNLNPESLVKKTYRKFHKTRKYSYRTFKRFVDICAGLVGCLILIPLTIFVKVISILNGDSKCR